MNKIKKVPHLWGDEYILENNELYCGKILAMYSDGKSSLQYHKEKDETFIVLRGTVEVGKCGEIDGLYGEGAVIRIKPGTLHYFKAVEVNHNEDNWIRYEVFGMDLTEYDALVLELSTHYDPGDTLRISEGRKSSRQNNI